MKYQLKSYPSVTCEAAFDKDGWVTYTYLHCPYLTTETFTKEHFLATWEPVPDYGPQAGNAAMMYGVKPEAEPLVEKTLEFMAKWKIEVAGDRLVGSGVAGAMVRAATELRRLRAIAANFNRIVAEKTEFAQRRWEEAESLKAEVESLKAKAKDLNQGLLAAQDIAAEALKEKHWLQESIDRLKKPANRQEIFRFPLPGHPGERATIYAEFDNDPNPPAGATYYEEK